MSMTKREALNEWSNRLERITNELEHMTKLMSLSDSHEAGVTHDIMVRNVQRIRKLAQRPSMERELEFKEPS